MSKRTIQSQRRGFLHSVHGKILEIGLGTGLNLQEYQKSVSQIETADINPGMNSLAIKRAKKAGIQIKHHIITAENLPMEDNSYDFVVSTWTLCSIPNIDKALAEIYRVLKPGGSFLFLEHGLHKNPDIQSWQNKITPIWKIGACGCHLNRDIPKIISKQPFNTLNYNQFSLPGMNVLVRHTYQGIAIK